MKNKCFTENDIKTIKSLISYKNNMKFLGRKILFPQIKEENIFVSDEYQTMRNVFKLVKDDYDFLSITYKNDLLRRISKSMFNAGMITADECQTNYGMYNSYSPWGWIR